MPDWIEWKWTPEKPYPETLETRVLVKFRDGKERLCKVRLLHHDIIIFSRWYDNGTYDDAVTYKVVK